MSIAVVYLARGRDAGLGAVDAFFRSYELHRGDAKHRLVVAAKGWEQQAELDQLRARTMSAGGQMIVLPDDGYDWGAYMRVAAQLSDDWICFLNSHSRIRADGWLAKLHAAAEQPSVGAAGATGSWSTVAPVPGFIAPAACDIARGDGYIKAAIAWCHMYGSYPLAWLRYRRRFPAFPNPHLRSNAFLIRRTLFLEFARTSSLPRAKGDAFALESGHASLTRFLSKRGLSTVVVGADGRSYKPADWIESGTFRVPDQPNLIVEDNQTRAYDRFSVHKRRLLERTAWGRAVTPVNSGER